MSWSYWQTTVMAVPHLLSTNSSDAVIGPGSSCVIGCLWPTGRRR